MLENFPILIWNLLYKKEVIRCLAASTSLNEKYSCKYVLHHNEEILISD